MNIIITELNSYEGKDTAMIVTPNSLFAVIDAETGEMLDNGYRSFTEAARAWREEKIVNLSRTEKTTV